MTHSIEIKIECKGNAAGTLGWFNSIIENSTLSICNTKSGGVGMFLKTKEGDKVKNKFICKADLPLLADPAQYKLWTNGMVSVWPVGDECAEGLFDIALTPSCHAKVEEFIEQAVDEFYAWWTEQ